MRRPDEREAPGDATSTAAAASDRARAGASSRADRDGVDSSSRHCRSDPVAVRHRRVGNQTVQRLAAEDRLPGELAEDRTDRASEREADRVADRVLRGATDAAERAAEPHPDGSERTGRSRGGAGASSRRHVADLDRGDPLPPDSRSLFERRFGRDFGDVRIHEGPRADDAARRVDARAFTVGSHVVFRSGAFRPSTRSGKRLLAHELTHVVQQRSGAPTIQRQTDGDAEPSYRYGSATFDETAQRALRLVLPEADAAHLTFDGETLGYDRTYEAPVDAPKWRKLTRIVEESGTHPVHVRAVSASQAISTTEVDLEGGAVVGETDATVSLAGLTANGLTLPSRDLLTNAYTTGTEPISPSGDRSLVLFDVSSADSISHELFGHFWLYLQGAPAQHGERIPQGSGVRGPLGEEFTGSVDEYIRRFADAGRIAGEVQSQTAGVGWYDVFQLREDLRAAIVREDNVTVSDGIRKFVPSVRRIWGRLFNAYEAIETARSRDEYVLPRPLVAAHRLAMDGTLEELAAVFESELDDDQQRATRGILQHGPKGLRDEFFEKLPSE